MQTSVKRSLLFFIIATALVCLAYYLGVRSGFTQNQASFPIPRSVIDEDFVQLPRVQGTPKNAVIVIGDGLGNAHLESFRIKSRGVYGSIALDQMPVSAQIRTHSYNAVVTDSAAAGTALASGVKAPNRSIGLDAQQTELRTLFDRAIDAGKKVGVVTNAALTDATPASFYAHSEDRYDSEFIAAQFGSANLSLALGGGAAAFLPSGAGGIRIDSRNLLDELSQQGYTVLRSTDDLRSHQPNPQSVFGVFAENDLAYGKAGDPPLSALAKVGLESFSGLDSGFILVIEASDIDDSGHDRDADILMEALDAFDSVVQQVLDFAIEDGNTLVVVTSDHETGGVIIEQQTGEERAEMVLGWNAGTRRGAHSGVTVPLYAYGPGSDIFSGLYQNTEVPKRIAQLLQLP